jgi:hypothetical protein
MSNWAEEDDDTDFFSETSFQAYKKRHDQDMIKILQCISSTKSLTTCSEQLSLSTDSTHSSTDSTQSSTDSTQSSTDSTQSSTDSTQPNERFTKVTKKKQWKQHYPFKQIT